MKKVLVTGAAGGMGIAICQKLLEKGYEIYGIDVKKELRLAGAEYFSCDVTKAENVASVREKIGEVDAIIHAAGIYDMDSLIEMDEERFMRMFNVNLFGVYRLNREFIPIMKNGSRIIIITSELAPLAPLPFTGVYALTKSVLDKYAFSLRMEVNLRNIEVSVIRPGAVDTGLLGDSTAALERFCANTALYECNAERFKRIVNSIETRSISADMLADKVLQALTAKKMRYIYNINRNILLLLLNALPKRLQVWIIKSVLR